MKDDFPYHLERDLERIWTKIFNRWSKPIIGEIKKTLSGKSLGTDADEIRPSQDQERRILEIIGATRALTLSENDLKEIEKFYRTLNGWSYSKASEAVEELKKTRLKKKKFFPTIQLDPDSKTVLQFQESYVEFNKTLVRELGKEWISGVTETIQKGFIEGTGAKTLASQLLDFQGVQENKASFWARDQLGDAYGTFTEQRFKEAGIPGYVWMTSQDNRVRDTHALLHGRFFTFKETPPGLSKPNAKLPGFDYNCRCRSLPAIDETDQLSEEQRNKVILGINKEREDFGQPKVQR